MNTKRQKIPILFFLHFLKGFSGTEKHLYELTTKLNKDKYIPFVGCIKLKERMRKIFEDNNVRVMEFPIKRVYNYDVFKYGFDLFKFIKKENIRIIQSFHLLPDIFVPIIARLAGVPIVISSRRDLGFDKKKRHIFVQRGINVLVDKIIVNSNAVKETLIANENVATEKITRIYNGVSRYINRSIDDGMDLRRKLGYKQSDLVVGLLANFQPIKGIKYFINACPLILNQIPNAKFLIVGGGPLLESLKERARDVGIIDQTIFTGHLLNGANYLAAMDVSVNSSLSEGFSNTILESMASGKPVVATNVGGNPEAVVDGKTGFLVPSKNSSALADAIITILKDKKLTQSMGSEAKKRVETFFNMERMMSKMDNLYESLLMGNSYRACGA